MKSLFLSLSLFQMLSFEQNLREESETATVQIYNREINRDLCGKILSNKRLMPNPYNPRFNKSRYQPKKYLFACTADEIIKGLSYCQNQNNDVRTCTIRSHAGHSYIGQSTTSGGLVIDLRFMDTIDIISETDSSHPIVKIGAGTRLLEVYSKLYLSPHKLGFSGGSCPSVSLGGFIQGGGHGLSSRQWGIGSDSLDYVEAIVNRNGKFEKIRADSKNEHFSFFKAVRGGMGGNYGVITSHGFKSVGVAPDVVTYVFKKTIENVNIINNPEVMNIIERTISWQSWLRGEDDTYGIFKFIRENSFNNAVTFEFIGQCFCDNFENDSSIHGGFCTKCTSKLALMANDIFSTTNCIDDDDATNVVKNTDGPIDFSTYLDKCSIQELPFGEAMWMWGGCQDLWPKDADRLPEAMASCFELDRQVSSKPYKSKSLYLPETLSHSFLKKAVMLIGDSKVCGEVIDEESVGNPCLFEFDLYDGEMLNRPLCADPLNPGENIPCDSFIHRNKAWHVQILAFWENGANTDYFTDLINWTRQAWSVLEPDSLGESYQNYIDDDIPRETWKKLYFGETSDWSNLVKKNSGEGVNSDKIHHNGDLYRFLQNVKCNYNSVSMFDRTETMSIEMPMVCFSH